MPHQSHPADSESSTSSPRGLKVFGIIFMVLVLLVVTLHITGA